METIETVMLRQQLVEDAAEIVTKNFGLYDFQKAALVEELSRPNFVEFWFAGTMHGSFKVFMTSTGVPFVFDQNKSETHRKIVEDNNKALMSLVEQFRKDYAAFSK